MSRAKIAGSHVATRAGLDHGAENGGCVRIEFRSGPPLRIETLLRHHPPTSFALRDKHVREAKG
jgi:hypothetical protein